MCPILSLHLPHSQPITSGPNIGEAQYPGYYSGSETRGGADERNGSGFDYVEHLLVGLRSITYYGKTRDK
jgi:hypothetical protein